MRKLCYFFCILALLENHSAPPGAQTEAPGVSPGLKTQILLDRAGFSPGELDGNIGKNTRLAVEAFQKEKGMNATGKPDSETLAALSGGQGPELLVPYTISQEDVAGPFAEKIPQDFMEQAKLEALNYTSPLEALGEKFHSNPALLKALNKGSKFQAGDVIQVPNVQTEGLQSSNTRTQAKVTQTHARDAQTQASESESLRRKGAPQEGQAAITVIVTQESSSVEALNEAGDVIFHAPATTGSEHDPLPTGEWKVTGVSRNPVFLYNPELFWDADPKNSKAKIAAGPNNPVGVVWIDVSKEHYGLHGTPAPDRIGYSESYGCVRMTNWDAARLASIVKPGTKIIFQ